MIYSGYSDSQMVSTQTPSKASVFYLYPRQTILKGLVKEVKVVDGNDPKSFFCQLMEESQDIDDLMKHLQDTYASNGCFFGCINIVF